jgi:hypothetical protein
MASIRAVMRHNELPRIDASFPDRVNRGIRKQVLISEGDAKVNIVKYDAIDTGNMLGSVRGEMTGFQSGQVTVSAESGKGYPYPAAVNFGTIHMAPRPFWSDMEAKAESEFADTVRREVMAGL